MLSYWELTQSKLWPSKTVKIRFCGKTKNSNSSKTAQTWIGQRIDHFNLWLGRTSFSSRLERTQFFHFYELLVSLYTVIYSKRHFYRNKFDFCVHNRVRKWMHVNLWLYDNCIVFNFWSIEFSTTWKTGKMRLIAKLERTQGWSNVLILRTWSFALGSDKRRSDIMQTV